MLLRADQVGVADVETLAEPVPEEGPVARTLRRMVVQGVFLGSLVLGDDVVGRRARRTLLALAGADLAPNVTMGGNTFVSRPENLVVGANSYLGRRCYLDLEGPLVIGSGVCVGHGVSFITTRHDLGPSQMRCGAFSSAAITVGDGAWLGANVTVLPGVVIGAGAVVAAGSVVSRDVAPNTLVGGRRARLIRTLD